MSLCARSEPSALLLCSRPPPCRVSRVLEQLFRGYELADSGRMGIAQLLQPRERSGNLARHRVAGLLQDELFRDRLRVRIDQHLQDALLRGLEAIAAQELLTQATPG